VGVFVYLPKVCPRIVIAALLKGIYCDKLTPQEQVRYFVGNGAPQFGK
jgi:hypothetical protein